MSLEDGMFWVAALSFAAAVLYGWAYKLGWGQWSQRFSYFLSIMGGLSLGIWIFLAWFT